jgi:phage tail sheath gpL-like
VTIIIQGFPDTYKVPGCFAETKFGAGGISFGSIPQYLLLMGSMASGGTATPDQDIIDIGSDADADTYFLAGSELARMCYQARRESGIRLKAMPISDPGGAVAASATITIATDATSSGEWVYRLAGVEVRAAVASGANPTTQATAIKNAFNAHRRLPVTAGSSSGVVTLTMKSKGIRGNSYILMQNRQTAPSGSTSTLAGGSAVVSSVPLEEGVFLSAGSGTDDVTAALAVLFAGRYHRIAAAHIDATNIAAIEAQLDTKAGPTVGRMEHAIFGSVASLSSATSIAQTTLNNERCELVWCEQCESPPSELAARMAAARLAKEQSDPNSNFDDYVLTGIRGQANRSKWASEASKVSALDNSVTPLMSHADGSVTVVRAITTKSLTGSTPDYRTLDVGYAVTPDAVRDDLALQWQTVFAPNNPKVRDDPAPEEPEPPAGVATPTRWNGFVLDRAKREWAKKLWILPPTSATAPTSEFNQTAKRIMSKVPVITHPLQHQIGVSVQETSSV